MRILITGCNGFTAQDTIRVLSCQHTIIGIGRQAANDHVDEYYQADITNRNIMLTGVASQIANVDAVVHFAAVMEGNEQEFYYVNCLGTQNVVDLAKKLGSKHFIYVSSVPIIGRPTKTPVTEGHLVQPESTYHLTKYLGEQIVELLNNTSMFYKIFRIASPVGHGMPENKIFSVFANNAANNEDISIYGTGTRIQNYIDTRDLAKAVEYGLQNDCNGLYLISGNSISDLELAQACISVCESQSKVIINDNDLEQDRYYWILDGAKAKKELGYVPGKSICESIKYVSNRQ